MEGVDVPFNKVQELSGEQVYSHIKKSFIKHKGADAIYMLGSGWRTLHIVDMLERDLGIPVVHPVTARHGLSDFLREWCFGLQPACNHAPFARKNVSPHKKGKMATFHRQTALPRFGRAY